MIATWLRIRLINYEMRSRDVRELQLKPSELKRDPALAQNERVERLETLASGQRDLLKKPGHENQHLKLKTRALIRRVRDLKAKSVAIDAEPARITDAGKLVDSTPEMSEQQQQTCNNR